MTQALMDHRFAAPRAIAVDADLLDVVIQYFAYVALVSVACAVVVVSLGLTANVAVGFLDRIVKPAFIARDSLAFPTLADKPNGTWRTSTRVAG